MAKEFDSIGKRTAADSESVAAQLYHPIGMTKDEHDEAVRRAARQAWDTLSIEEQADLIRDRPQLAALCQAFFH